MDAEAVVADLFRLAFRPRSAEKTWEWAERNVWLDERMAARPGYYDASLTPWAKEFMEIPRMPDVRVGVAMKDNQSGFTEAALNALRRMPEDAPGNALYCINSIPKAKRVNKIRLRGTLKEIAKEHLTDDPDDFSQSSILLENMEITISGSGSVGAFAEAWYRLAILDECELHEEDDGTTTFEKVQTRFKTVEDATLLALSKPELEGGIIDQKFCIGTQEEWEVPCPLCGEHQRIEMDWLRFGHCKDLADGWDLARVEAETWLECRHCNGRIEHGSLPAMNARGKWVPRPVNERRKLNGKAVPPEPGVRSFHMSALYSMFPDATWGKIARRWLMAFVLTPSESLQRTWWNNDAGLPAPQERASITPDAISNLRGGIVEEVDGRRQVLGRKFSLVYEPKGVGRSELVGKLWFRPALLTITLDRQDAPVRFPYLVYAWNENWESFLVDYGDLPDDEAVVEMRARPYPVAGEEEPAYLMGGFADCGDKKIEVCRMCLRAQSMGFDLHPSRGQGFRPGSLANIRARRDNVDGADFLIYDFYDHAVTSDFLLGKVGRRREPRLWLPDPVPERIAAEWASTKLVTIKAGHRHIQQWVNERRKDGPNDLMDCGKQQLLVPWLLGAGLQAEERPEEEA